MPAGGKTLLTVLDVGYRTEDLRDSFEQGWPDFLDASERALAARA